MKKKADRTLRTILQDQKMPFHLLLPPRWHSSSRGSWVWGEAATIRLNGSWVAKRLQKLNENIEATHKEEKPLTVQVQAIGITQSLVFHSGCVIFNTPANNIFRWNSSKDTKNFTGHFTDFLKCQWKFGSTSYASKHLLTKILGASSPSEGPLLRKKTAIFLTSTSPFSVQVSLQSVTNESLDAELSLMPFQRIIEGNKKCWLDKILWSNH